jgi:prepilin-type N-terminal cleavage/methylation domain-containing protein
MRRRGYTLIETIMTMVILGIIALLLYGILDRAFQAWLTGQGQSASRQDARIFLEKFTRDLRAADQVLTALPAVNVTAFSFTNDYNNDGSSEAFSYSLSGSEILRTINGLPVGGTSMIDNVADFKVNVATTTSCEAVVYLVVTDSNGKSSRLQSGALIRSTLQ